jgi:hypothetical protein
MDRDALPKLDTGNRTCAFHHNDGFAMAVFDDSGMSIPMIPNP